MIPKKNYSLHFILKNLKYLHFLQKNQLQSSIVIQGSMDQFFKVTELRSSYNLTKMFYSSNNLTTLNSSNLQLHLTAAGNKANNVNPTKKTFFYYSPSFFQPMDPLLGLMRLDSFPFGVDGVQVQAQYQNKYRKKTKNKWFDWVATKKDINAVDSAHKADNSLNQRQISKEEFNKIFSIHNLNDLNSETVPLMKYSKLHEFKLVTISIASADKIKEWAEKILPNGKIFGEVTNANTLHYKTFKPHKGGLFCERIFGPLKDFECACGIYSKPSEIESKKILEHQQIKRHFCSNCDVEYTWSVIRRYQLGYIQLVSAVSHVWYLKANPSYLSLLLDFKKSFLESIIYCTQSITLENLFRKSEIKNLDTSAKNLYSIWQKLIEEDKTSQTKNSFLSTNKTNTLFSNKKFLKLQTRLKIIQIYSQNQRNSDKKFRFSKVRQIFNESFSPKYMTNSYFVYKNFLLKYKFHYSYYLINNICFICSTNQTTVLPNDLNNIGRLNYFVNRKQTKNWVDSELLQLPILPFLSIPFCFLPSHTSPNAPSASLIPVTTLTSLGNPQRGFEVKHFKTSAPKINGLHYVHPKGGVRVAHAIRTIHLHYLPPRGGLVGGLGQRPLASANQGFGEEPKEGVSDKLNFGKIYVKKFVNFSFYVQKLKQQKQFINKVFFKNSFKFFYFKKNYCEILQIKEKIFLKKFLENKPNFDFIFMKDLFFIQQQSIWFEKNVVNIYFFVFFTSILFQFPNLFALNYSNAPQIKISALPCIARSATQSALALRATVGGNASARQASARKTNKVPILQIENYFKEILWTILMKQENFILLGFTKYWSNSRLQDSKTYFYSSVFLKSKIRPILKTPKDFFYLTGIKLNKKIQKINTMLTNSLVLLNYSSTAHSKISVQGQKTSIIPKKFIAKNINFYKQFCNNSKLNSLENIFIQIFKNFLRLHGVQAQQTSNITSTNSWFEQQSISGPKNSNPSKNIDFSGTAPLIPQRGFACTECKRRRNAGNCTNFPKLRMRGVTEGVQLPPKGVALRAIQKTCEKKKTFFLQKQTQIKFKKFYNKTNFERKKSKNRAKNSSRSIRDIEKFLPKSFFLKKFLTALHSMNDALLLTPVVAPKINGANDVVTSKLMRVGQPRRGVRHMHGVQAHKLKNNLYTISYFYAWSNNTNWKSFLYYNSKSPKIEDKNINYYKNRNLLSKATKTKSFQGKTIAENFSESANRSKPISSELLPFMAVPSLAGKEGIERNRNRKEDTRQIDQTKHLEIFTGASLIQKILTEFDSHELKKMIKQHQISIPILNRSIRKLKKSFKKKTDFIKIQKLLQKRDHIIKRLKFLSKISSQNTNPNSMILSVLPVLPPDLRPILKLQNQIAASDLNRLYQRIIYRNERLKKFLKDPSLNSISSIKGNTLLGKSVYPLRGLVGGQLFEMRYAQRLLQESVDNLIENGKGSVKPETNSRGQPLKSLSEILKGKQGRFRQYLLGKRVDYSGRSVIVVGPKLKLSECGLPLRIAIELFLPFLIKKILHYKLARTVIGAKNFINAPTGTINQKITWNLLNEIMKNHPILLNRAPTLHRLGIQAFIPKLIYGQAILLHPLVCSAFNADFDGDQMAVHVPITVEARTEAWSFLFSRNHLLSAATGEPIILPSQDMVLGCYYLTSENLTVDLKQIYSKNKAEKIANKFLNQSTKIDVFSQKNLLTNNFLNSEVQSFNLKQVSHMNRIAQLRANPLRGYALPPEGVSALALMHVVQQREATKGQGIEEGLHKGDKKSEIYHIKRMYFSDWDSVLTAYQTNQIELQSILWLKWNGLLEQATNESFLPIEIRINSFGHIQKISSKIYLNSDSKGQVLSQYIRTTPGRVLLNTIIKNCIRF